MKVMWLLHTAYSIFSFTCTILRIHCAGTGLTTGYIISRTLQVIRIIGGCFIYVYIGIICECMLSMCI